MLGDLVDGLLDLRIVPGDVERRLVLLERFGQLAAAMMDFRESANRRKVFRRGAQDVLEFLLGFVEAAELEQRAAERDVSGQIGRMPLNASLTSRDRFFEPSGPPVLFREGRKGDRRRVHLDPAFQFFNPRAVGHQCWSVPPLFFEGAMDSSSSDGNATGTV